MFLGKDYHSGGSEMEPIIKALEQIQIHSQILAARLDTMQESINLLRQRVSDIEHEVEEIPNLGKILAAVQELQDQYEAPASVFTHYISGGVPR